MPFLIQTKIRISKILVFLKETSICTRNWYNKRKEEVERDVFDFDFDL